MLYEWMSDGMLKIPFTSAVLVILCLVIISFVLQIKIWWKALNIRDFFHDPKNGSVVNIRFILGYIAIIIIHTIIYLLPRNSGCQITILEYICHMLSDLMLLAIIHSWIFFVATNPDLTVRSFGSMLPETYKGFHDCYKEIEKRFHKEDTKTTAKNNQKYFWLYTFLWWLGTTVWWVIPIILNTLNADYTDPVALFRYGLTFVLAYVSLAFNCESYYLSFLNSYFYYLITNSNEEYLKYPHNHEMPSATASLNRMIHSFISGARCFLLTSLMYTIVVGLILAPYLLSTPNNSVTVTKVIIGSLNPDAVHSIALFYFVAVILVIAFISFFVIYLVPRHFIRKIHHDWVIQELEVLESQQGAKYQRTKQIYEDKLYLPRAFEVYTLSILTMALQVAEVVFSIMGKQ